MIKNKLTDAEAQEMLKQLEEHFNGRVMPVSTYCNALRTWQKAMQKRAEHLRDELFPETAEENYKKDPDAYRAAWQEYQKVMDDPNSSLETRRDYAIAELRGYEIDLEAMSRVEMLIMKSSLLDRLIYGGEQLRTERCPIHDGTWSGLEMGEDRQCPYMCHLTGWVLHPTDVAKLREEAKKNEGKIPEDGCQECIWWKSKVYYPCKAHMDEWIDKHEHVKRMIKYMKKRDK